MADGTVLLFTPNGPGEGPQELQELLAGKFLGVGKLRKRMTDELMDALEIASEEVVKQAAHDFAAALVATPQFEAFEQASQALRHDEKALDAMEAYQAKQSSLQALLMLNALGPEEQAELERLRQAFMNERAVSAYFEAQSELMALCQASADLLSKHLGLSFAAACGPGCC